MGITLFEGAPSPRLGVLAVGADCSPNRTVAPPGAGSRIHSGMNGAGSSCNATAVEADKESIQAAMPKLPSDGSNPAPVKYNGGVIYTSIKSSAFRPLTTRGDKYSEKSCVKWKAQ